MPAAQHALPFFAERAHCGHQPRLREIVAGKVSVEEAYARLHEIVSIPYTHPIRLDLACAVGSACFSYLFGGTVFDAAAAFICGFVLQVFLNAIE